MKVSDITEKDLADYARVDITDTIEYGFFKAAFIAAKNYIMGRTGISEEELNEHEEFSIAIYCLVADMYDNRSINAEGGEPNRTVEAIINMHDKNFL